MPNAISLKYLFEAHLKDGTVIRQTPEDCSTAEPLTRSAFYDVAQRLDEVRLFGLYNDQYMYTVSLEDGHFEANGVPFSAQPVSKPVINQGGKFRLIYFRDHQQEFVVTASVGADGQVTESRSLGPHYHQYRMGWEYTDPTGVVYTQTIVVV
jgi:hypothetical protein